MLCPFRFCSLVASPTSTGSLTRTRIAARRRRFTTKSVVGSTMKVLQRIHLSTGSPHMASTPNELSVQELFDRLLTADDESEVAHYVGSIVTALGGESFVFVSLNPSESTEGRSSHRFLIGCRPEWCQLYNANKWFMTDPFLDYSMGNTEPVCGSQVEATTQGQKDMLASAHQNGFRSGFVVPVHTSDAGRIGVLYLGSDKPEEEGEKVF